MIVYTVSVEIVYEGLEIEGVFATEEAAHKYCQQKSGRLLPDIDDQYPIDGGGACWLRVDPWEVQE